MRISDWSSDVCSSDLLDLCAGIQLPNEVTFDPRIRDAIVDNVVLETLGCSGKILTNLGGGKNIGVISLVDRIIDKLPDKVTCLLLLDLPRCLKDEVHRVCATLFEHCSLNASQT